MSKLVTELSSAGVHSDQTPGPYRPNVSPELTERSQGSNQLEVHSMETFEMLSSTQGICMELVDRTPHLQETCTAKVARPPKTTLDIYVQATELSPH